MTEWHKLWASLLHDGLIDNPDFPWVLSVQSDFLRKIKAEGDKMQEELKSAHKFHKWALLKTTEAIKDQEKRNAEWDELAKRMKEILDK